METNYNEDEELKKIAPHLFKLKKEEVFEVPENYFEKLPGIMQDKVHSKAKVKSFWVPDYKLALAAASVCLLVVVGIKYWNAPNQESKELAGVELMQDYDNQYLASADEQELAEQLDDESLDNTSAQIDENSGIDNQEIEDYLISNNIDITTISNEF
jgi:negative regulator of sigma E activity